jgi:hypothetical protein
MKSNFVAIISLALAHSSNAAAVDAAAIQAAMQGMDAGIKADHYDVARVDLDDDGTEDVLALMNGKSGYCGSGGCTLFVLRTQKGGLGKVGAIKVVNAPIFARKERHHGWRDLLVTVRGGGAKPGLAALAFDGSSYPAGPGEAMAREQDGDQVVFAEPTPPFEKGETLQGITFKVTSPNTPSGNSATLTPSGLEADNQPITAPVNGIITRIEVADINVDGSPEIYIYGFDGTSQTVLAYGANKKKSLSQIFLPELKDDAKNAKGYRGRDEFAVVEGILARRFPIFPEDAAESKPTSKIRQLQYKLHAGEAGWMLKVDKVVEF